MSDMDAGVDERDLKGVYNPEGMLLHESKVNLEGPYCRETWKTDDGCWLIRTHCMSHITTVKVNKYGEYVPFRKC